ncbi:hypothetical protein BC937DRAFT_92712 [Endogone sp. FLAS-F59071]|nr:hypothetical protein BC937DRAFT_92712 [Endogone sp. FLAS-F59071]|eukprot:RUS15242.1 hypothetical protein BC937DRAFT_92712 [Endogone sp. FLAS-F59071]
MTQACSSSEIPVDDPAYFTVDRHWSLLDFLCYRSRTQRFSGRQTARTCEIFSKPQGYNEMGSSTGRFTESGCRCTCFISK